jgi:hypothetical protein
VEYESIIIYFNKSRLPEFDFETFSSITMLSYYASISCTQNLKLIGKGVQFTYTSIVAFTFMGLHYIVFVSAEIVYSSV